MRSLGVHFSSSNAQNSLLWPSSMPFKVRLLAYNYAQVKLLTCDNAAHSHAFEDAKILHRDISAGNIILTSEGRGLLIDWELAKDVNEGGSRRPDRTVSYSVPYRFAICMR